MLHITTHSGKLTGMHSISTSAIMNRHCAQRQDLRGSICEKCYAKDYLSFRKSLRVNMEDNTRQLTTRLLPPAELPTINDRYFRLEAFGDIANVTQVENYFNICRKNHGTQFALWTKNPAIIAQALRQAHKPVNLIIIYSSPMINRPVNDRIFSVFPFIDKVFTVYDKSHAQAVTINCGGRKCLECRRCYSKRTGKRVNEILK